MALIKANHTYLIQQKSQYHMREEISHMCRLGCVLFSFVSTLLMFWLNVFTIKQCCSFFKRLWKMSLTSSLPLLPCGMFLQFPN